MVETDSMVMDITLPEAYTMQAHLAAVNPHPQYVQVSQLKSAVNTQVKLDDLVDVTISGSNLDGKVLALSGAMWKPIDVNSLVSQTVIPSANASTYGIVRYATMEDVSAGNTAAISPTTMAAYVSDYLANTKAGPTTQGTVKLAATDAEIAAAITAGQFIGLVEQVDQNRYVNTHATTEGSMLYYSTHAEPVSNVLTGYEPLDAGPRYLVYSDGILQSHVNVNRTDEVVQVLSCGNAYDTSMCGTLGIANNGTAHRTTLIPPAYVADSTYAINTVNDTTYSSPTKSLEEMVSSANVAEGAHCTWAVIEGTAHNLICSTSNWIIAHNVVGSDGSAAVVTYPKCLALVRNKGHVEYATVEGTGEIMCAGEGIVEHVLVRNTQSDALQPNHYGLVMSPNGSGYHITLNGSYARASIQGFAEDVKVYGGCQLDVQYTTANLKNVTLYNGARMVAVSGATIEGLIRYPGAAAEISPDCTVLNDAQCHEPDKPIQLVYGMSNVISSSIVSGRTELTQENYFQFKPDGSYTSRLSYSDALMLMNANVTIIKDGASPSSYTEERNLVQTYAIDTPRLFVKTDYDMLSSAAAATDITSMGLYISSAHSCVVANILSCTDTTKYGPKQFIISAPEDMYNDLVNSSGIVEWKLVF